MIGLPHDLCDTGEVLVPYLTYLLELVERTSITYEFVIGTVTGIGVTNAPHPLDVTRVTLSTSCLDEPRHDVEPRHHVEPRPLNCITR